MVKYYVQWPCVIRIIGLLAALILSCFRTLHALDISNVPLETAIVAPPPIIMFVLDNSGSMNMEFMTDEFQGLFHGAYYLFPDTAYRPAPDHRYGLEHALSPSQRRLWRSQWSGANHLYYSPLWRYDPWPSTRRYTFEQADLQHPASDPTRQGRDAARIIMTAEFFRVRGGDADIIVANAHYFTYYDADGNGRLDDGEAVYLVTWEVPKQDGILDSKGIARNGQRNYYRFLDDGDGTVEDNELLLVGDEAEKNLLRPGSYNPDGSFQRFHTSREELQNFVNWYTYYRRREFAAKAIVAQCIKTLHDIHVGLYAVNTAPRVGAQWVEGNSSSSDNAPAGGKTDELLDALYAMESTGGTSLRAALDQVGRYFHQRYTSELGASPFQPNEHGGGCQKACSVVVTDGYWNGVFTGAGNRDGDNGSPYADSWSDTLADVAMTYYEDDLAPNLNDLVPATGCDTVAHQHMNTHTISFGPDPAMYSADSRADGNITEPCPTDGSSIGIDWPQPLGNLGMEANHPVRHGPPGDSNYATGLRNDLRHAALNGRGRYFDAYSPKALIETLPGVISEMSTPASAADVTVSSIDLRSNAMVFQAMYHTKDWSGEVTAYSLDGQGRAIPGPGVWHASNLLKATGENWDQRRIVTYGGRWAQPQGIPFRFSAMSARQLYGLTQGPAPDEFAGDLVDFIRGKSIDKFRNRETLLGDIVHSGPVLFGHSLFVGANDGMLHILDSCTGAERLAYIPGLISGHLKDLSDFNYTDHHRYFVDGPLYAGEVAVGEYQRDAYLIGGLGKGGKGYFCLQIGQRERIRIDGRFGDYRWSWHVDDVDSSWSEAQAANLIRWEYPRPDTTADGMDNNGDGYVDEPGEYDPDIGYSFGQAYVVNANTADGSYRPVAIFGNGYDSDHQKAVLYILSVESGAIIRTIDTGAGGDNGLSTPALIDVDLDRRVDYAYAGDLLGNLWKFDLTSDDPRQWGVAYGEDNDGDGVIDSADGDRPAPLFQALGQPITGRPNVMAMQGSCTAGAPGFMVYFGTGRYLGFSDLADAQPQGLYAIWDYGDDSDDSENVGWLTSQESGSLSSGLALAPKQVSGQTTEDGMMVRQVSAENIQYTMVEDTEDGDGSRRNNSTEEMAANPEQYAGWFLNLTPSANAATGAAERITGDVVIRGGKIIVPSYVPDSTPCGRGGHSWLYILDACNGDTPPDPADEPILSRRFQGKINNRPAVIKDLSQPRLDRIVLSDHSGNILNLELDGETWGKVYWRQNTR